MMPSPRPESASTVHAYGPFAKAVKARVDARLGELSDRQAADAGRISNDTGVVIAALFDLVRRGGKRVRPILLSAAHAAWGGDVAGSAIVDAGAALEILHAYLLIHDDWMDDDDMRRGAPSVHVALREVLGSRSRGDACAILAGDYAQGVAFDLLARMDAPPIRVVAALAEASRVLSHVVTGQIMDVCASANSSDDTDLMHRLKTSSYTTTGPLVIGALLAGASPGELEELRSVGDALGLAFQLTDDVLGTFGDPERTGKPVGSDLRRGKKTALVAELASDREAQRILPRVLGVEDAPAEEIAAVLKRMVASGAKARIEARALALTQDARARIEALDISAEGRALLFDAASELVGRQA
jgi:geranylgeranyl diphosphate synthase, type I